MSDDDTKDDALIPRQVQPLANRSAALVRRGLAQALEIDNAKERKLTTEQWGQVVEQVQEYLGAIRARRNSDTHGNDEPGTKT
jgi:hypothetical protein